MNTDKKQKALIDIINEMFRTAGYDVTYDDIKDRKDDWFLKWSIDDTQRKEWIDWSIAYLRKNLKYSKNMAERVVLFLDMDIGLTHKNTD